MINLGDEGERSVTGYYAEHGRKTIKILSIMETHELQYTEMYTDIEMTRLHLTL